VRHDDFEFSLQRTKLFIGNEEVDPWTVAVNLAAPSDSSHRPARLTIDAVMLLHELQQAGVDVSRSSLGDFVSRDLAKNPQVALEAYLGIVRQALFPATRSFLGLITRQRTEDARWVWVKTGDVSADEDAVTIVGLVNSIARSSG
jgi:hypothetical protein